MPGHADQPNDHAVDATRGRQRASYLAECYWPGVTAARLADAAASVAGDAEATCVELILIPGIVLGLFEASSAAAVTRASCRAGLPAERIVTALHVTPAPSRRQPPSTPIGRPAAQPSHTGTSSATTAEHGARPRSPLTVPCCHAGRSPRNDPGQLAIETSTLCA